METVITRVIPQGQPRQLAQKDVTSTLSFSLYSPDEGVQTVIKSVVICNTAGVAKTWRLFHDEDGTTYDDTTALFYDKTVDASQTEEVSIEIFMNDSNGNLAFKCDTTAVCVTVYGEESQKRAG